ncbi:transglutaminase-like domain-containing protein [Propionibacteriaceae bacterium Y1923]|uniref:transglutaminase-like domain-containing protein n=1 Tax=Aestuariimicrobium sp. Y1814 TaxID=3418742 RepID=UPI003C1BAC94
MNLPPRRLTSQLDVTISQPADIVFSVAVAATYTPAEEVLTMHLDGQPIDFHEISTNSGTRLHRVSKLPAGKLRVSYSALVDSPSLGMVEGEDQEIIYGRPSRYCDSDRLGQVAWTHFHQVPRADLVQAIRNWVNQKISYTPGSSRVVDGALETYLSRKGVCRDMAHLVITFCRAMNIPARLVSVYAPGLKPMDFHAVAEVYFDGGWHLVDATGLAPRQTMVRIATGRDASDTAFMTTMSGLTTLDRMSVTAIVEGDLPTDDAVVPVSLG